MEDNYIKGITIEKRECKRLGYQYVDLFNYISSILYNPQIKSFVNENAIEQFENFCIDLQTNKIEIIEFGRII